MLGEVVEQIDSAFSIGAAFLINVLHFNYLFVSALAGSFHSIALFICNTLCSLICACGYALNDLIVFISEVIGGIVMLLTLIGDTLDYVKLTIQCSVQCIAMWIVTVFTTVWKNFVGLLQFASFLVSLIFSAVVLLLQLFPLLFIQIVTGFAGAIAYAVMQVRHAVYFMTEIPKHVLDAFLEIPPGAYLGCLMLVVSCITIKLVRYLLRTFAFNLRSMRFANRLRFFMLRGYILTARNVSRAMSLINFRRVVPEIEDDLNVGAQDDAEDLNEDDAMEIDTSLMYIEEMTTRNRFGLDTSSEESTDEYTKTDLHSLKSKLKKERERLLCVICQDNAKCMMLLPCRHLCMCQNCVSVIMQDRNVCPICRRPIHEVMRVYL